MVPVKRVAADDADAIHGVPLSRSCERETLNRCGLTLPVTSP